MVNPATRIAVLVATIFLIVIPLLAEDVYIDEIEFAPYIIMPETLLYKLINKDKDYILYDLRDPERFWEGHIKGAMNYPWNERDAFEAEMDLTGDKTVVFVCEDGKDAYSALRYMLEMGYSNLWVVEGGMQNWVYKDWLEKGK